MCCGLGNCVKVNFCIIVWIVISEDEFCFIFVYVFDVELDELLVNVLILMIGVYGNWRE